MGRGDRRRWAIHLTPELKIKDIISYPLVSAFPINYFCEHGSDRPKALRAVYLTYFLREGIVHQDRNMSEVKENLNLPVTDEPLLTGEHHNYP